MANEQHTSEGMGTAVCFDYEDAVRKEGNLAGKALSGHMAHVHAEKREDLVRIGVYTGHKRREDLSPEVVVVGTEVAKTVPGWAVLLFSLGVAIVVSGFFAVLFFESGVVLVAMVIGFVAVAVSLWAAENALK